MYNKFLNLKRHSKFEQSNSITTSVGRFKHELVI